MDLKVLKTDRLHLYIVCIGYIGVRVGRVGRVCTGERECIGGRECIMGCVCIEGRVCIVCTCPRIRYTLIEAGIAH